MITKKSSFIVLNLLCISVIFGLFVFVSKPQLVTWDEAGYILNGYRIRESLATGDWPGLVKQTRNQVFYPFFQSFYVGLATLPFRYSIETARLVSLFLLWPVMILIWKIAQRLKPNDRRLPVLAVGLVALSPTLLFFFSLAMMEGLGLLLTLACLWLYWQARGKSLPALFFLTGLIGQAVIFTKYNYGLIVGGVLAAESLIWLLEREGYKKKNVWLSVVLLFTPVVSLSLWWFFLPGNKPVILGFVKSFGDFPASWMTHWLFYISELALGYTFSWIAFVVLAICFSLAAFGHRRDLKVRSLALLFLINFLVIMVKSPDKNQGRYLFTSVPAFFLVASLGLIELLPKIKRAHPGPVLKGMLLPLGVALGAMMVWGAARVPWMIRPTGSHQIGTAAFYEPDYQKNDHFNFNRKEWPRRLPPAGSEKVKDLFVFAFDEVNLDREIVQVGQANEISPLLFDFYLALARREGGHRPDGYQKYAIVFEVKPGSRFDTEDFRRANQTLAGWVAETLRDRSLDVVAQKDFTYLGVRVSVMGQR